MGVGHSPEAGYNLELRLTNGWSTRLAIVAGAFGLRRQEYSEYCTWPAEARIPHLRLTNG